MIFFFFSLQILKSEKKNYFAFFVFILQSPLVLNFSRFWLSFKKQWFLNLRGVSNWMSQNILNSFDLYEHSIYLIVSLFPSIWIDNLSIKFVFLETLKSYLLLFSIIIYCCWTVESFDCGFSRNEITLSCNKGRAVKIWEKVKILCI